MPDGLLRTVLAGDVMAKWPAGGMFTAEDVPAEQARFDRSRNGHGRADVRPQDVSGPAAAAEREAAVLVPPICRPIPSPDSVSWSRERDGIIWCTSMICRQCGKQTDCDCRSRCRPGAMPPYFFAKLMKSDAEVEETDQCN